MQSLVRSLKYPHTQSRCHQMVLVHGPAVFRRHVIDVLHLEWIPRECPPLAELR
jgi:hypothetical protein